MRPGLSDRTAHPRRRGRLALARRRKRQPIGGQHCWHPATANKRAAAALERSRAFDVDAGRFSFRINASVSSGRPRPVVRREPTSACAQNRARSSPRAGLQTGRAPSSVCLRKAGPAYLSTSGAWSVICGECKCREAVGKYGASEILRWLDGSARDAGSRPLVLWRAVVEVDVDVRLGGACAAWVGGSHEDREAVETLQVQGAEAP
jgi:hypothetical protein